MEHFIELLSQREAHIVGRLKELEILLQEYTALYEERRHIAALLAHHDARSTPPTAYAHVSHTTRARQSAGDTEKHVDAVLRTGEQHRIVSLKRRIAELFSITHADSTIGVVLRRGVAHGKYTREGWLWRMVFHHSGVEAGVSRKDE